MEERKEGEMWVEVVKEGKRQKKKKEMVMIMKNFSSSQVC